MKQRELHDRANAACAGWRRGVATMVLLLAIVAITAIFALGLNLGWIAWQDLRVQKACDAASLAGAPKLMDDGFLYLDPSRIPEAQVAQRAKAEAAAFAAANGVTLTAPSALPAPRRDVVTAISFDAPQTDRGTPSGDKAEARRRMTAEKEGALMSAGWTPEAELPAGVRAMYVEASMKRAKGNALRLWLGGMTRVAQADVAASSKALIDQRVIGFVPLSRVNVPLVPLAISASSSSTAWFAEKLEMSAPHSAPLHDHWTVEFDTGALKETGDGIPEVTLRIGGDGGRGSKSEDEGEEDEEGENTWVAMFRGRGSDFDFIPSQIGLGLATEDLETLGGQVALDAGGQLSIPRASAAGRKHLHRLKRALNGIQGKKRVWLLGDPAKKGGALRIVGFVAACVVKTEIVEREDHESYLEVVVEPCILQTSTSLLCAERAANPFLGKVMLAN